MSGVERARRYRLRNLESERMRSAEYYRRNASRLKGVARKRRAVEYRDGGVARATPNWVDMEAIRAVHRSCADYNARLPYEFNVRYVIPLRGRIVCGLHLAVNMRITSDTWIEGDHRCFTREQQEAFSKRYLDELKRMRL